MRDEVLGDSPLEREEPHKNIRHKKAHSAFLAASVARSAVAQVRHSHVGWANTGTNISYEGATAPGAGGCVGTGYASGKDAVDEHLRTYSDYEHMRNAHTSPREENNSSDDTL